MIGFWKRLFGKAKLDERTGAPMGGSKSQDERHADCAFCGRKLENSPSSKAVYLFWKCPCGAIGSGAWAPDLDEVGDQLLDILGINARVSQPCVPTGTSGIYAQRYDADKVKHDMAMILKRHGYELRITSRIVNECDESLFWVRSDES